MLNIDHIDVYYGAIHAIKGVTLEVHQGEIVSLIGANGAGKSTLLKTVSGLLRPKNGTITYQGKLITGLSAPAIVSQGLVQCPEGRRIFANMTVEENLELGAYLRKDKNIRVDLMNIYERFPILAERRKQPAGTLSGGEQQMLAIGRALMSKPSLLLLDEPSMGLAPMLVQEIFRVVEEINRLGTTVLLVEQNANQALRISDRAYVLETGNIVLSGLATDLANLDEVKLAYLGH